MLTDEQKARADELGLTYTEMHLALVTRIEPEVYARHKLKRQAQRVEWEAKLQEAGIALRSAGRVQSTEDQETRRQKDGLG